MALGEEGGCLPAHPAQDVSSILTFASHQTLFQGRNWNTGKVFYHVLQFPLFPTQHLFFYHVFSL